MDIGDFIGLPFESKGRNREGVDCWGLCYLFYADMFSIDIPSYSDDYTDAFNHDSVSDAILCHATSWVEINKSELQFGDILVFRVMGLPLHVGIFLTKNDFLHSWSGTMSCIERLNSITWAQRFLKAYRWTTA